ncbi:hypothetical protein RJ641_003172 [Dillenia turbinata]|uniref:Uncharacterized protein n=1 Tax=Dillenia turbinata TaxID=194707 RepID=A0AAN8Z955_9MAGN
MGFPWRDSDTMVCPSTLLHKLDSRPTEYNGNAMDSAGFKDDDDHVKGNLNGYSDHKGYEQDADPLQFKLLDREALNRLKFDSSISADDFKTSSDGEILNTGAPKSFVSSKMELCEKDSVIYTDKRVTECDLPEDKDCYTVNGYHVVKDICVDDGYPSKDKILVENVEVNDCLGSYMASDEGKESKLSNEFLDTKLGTPDGLNSLKNRDCNEDSTSHSSSKDSSNSDETMDKIEEDVSKEKIETEIVDKVSSSGRDEVEQDSVQISNDKATDDPTEEAALLNTTVMPTLEESKDGEPANALRYNSKVENGSITFDFKSSKPESKIGEEISRASDSQHVEDQNTAVLEHEKSDSLAMSNHLRHGHGESNYNLSGIAVQKEWQRRIEDILGNTEAGGRAFFVVDSEWTWPMI